MASTEQTSVPRPSAINSLASFRGLRILLAALLLASIVLDGLQAREMTFGRSQSDPGIVVKRQNRKPSRSLSDSAASDYYARSTPSNNYGRSPSMFSDRHTQCSPDYDFDYLHLTVMWSPGTCSTSKDACVHESASRFTIHGLWPNRKNHPQGPENCCFKNNFVIEYLKPIMPALEQWWPSYFTQNRVFWSHEWRKHGTCAKDIAALQGELNYFSTTINLVKKLAILETLRKANIVPSNDKKYDSESIVNALKTVHNKRIQIACEYEHQQPTPLITGLSFCYDRQLNPTDCPEMRVMCSRQSLKLPATVTKVSNGKKSFSTGSHKIQAKTWIGRSWSF